MIFYDIPKTIDKELDQFESDIHDFVSGKINPTKFKAIRVAHGVYEQRQENTYMVRIRCAAGGITPQQLKKVAELGDLYGNGEVHFTTRQEVQVHNVVVKDVMTVIRELLTVGLSSRGGGGNTIRNILTPPDSGVSKEEDFDVDPYAIALTTRLIHEEDSWNLPRKFKIAFSYNEKDSAITQSTCLGYVAQMKDSQKGFRVFCAGGMGAKPIVGHELLAWIPEDQVYHVARAIKTMFDKHGNRRSKTNSRIKFLWKKLDRDGFMDIFNEDYNKIKDDTSLALEVKPLDNSAKPTDLAPKKAEGDDYETWKRRYVTAQKQDGLNTIKINLTLGDLYRDDADKLCDFLEHFSDNTIRCERAQNMVLRNIPDAYLGNAFEIIWNMKKTLVKEAPFIGNMVNCTGASTCKLGICLPRGLSEAIRDRLSGSQLDLDRISDFRLNMSGCPNTCGLHHIANLGFFGKVGRSQGREMYPSYNVLAGAVIGAGTTKYAQKEGAVAAKHIPNFVHDFLEHYLDEKEDYETYEDYLDASGREQIHNLCETYKHVPELEEDDSFYYDFGAKKRLTLDEIGTAECSAGLFDMINVDKRFIKTHLATLDEDGTDQKEALYRILFHASRMLLVTRGLDAKDEASVFQLFGKHFVETELIDKSYSEVVSLGKNQEKGNIVTYKDQVLSLSQDVHDLYSNMDDSLRFKTKAKEEAASEKKVQTTGSGLKIDLEKDFKGVGCPMNFVKTKLALETMGAGQVLKITLDDGEPIQNVPNSIKLEGHEIVEKTQSQEGHWVVIIKKG